MTSRAHRILEAAEKLQEAINILDKCQAGDWRGQISPLKHQLMDAIKPYPDEIRAIARQAWDDEGSDQARRAIASWQLDDDYNATNQEMERLQEHLNEGHKLFPETLLQDIAEQLDKLQPKFIWHAGEDHPAGLRACIWCGLVERASADFHKPGCPVVKLYELRKQIKSEGAPGGE